MRDYGNLIGQRFGNLTVLCQTDGYISPSGHKQRQWLCQCDCGESVVATTSNLKGHKHQSCGACRAKALKNSLITHHGRYDRLYGVWCNMKNRCYNKNVRSYKDYGARGIQACEEWSHDYAAFRDWAMSHGYDPLAKYGACTIDRINVDGNYCPSNCRWVGMNVQNVNKRNKG